MAAVCLKSQRMRITSRSVALSSMADSASYLEASLCLSGFSLRRVKVLSHLR